jgi:hypothetical protein
MIYAVWEEKSNVNMRVRACEGTVTLEIETRNQKLRVWFNWEILLLRGGGQGIRLSMMDKINLHIKRKL